MTSAIVLRDISLQLGDALLLREVNMDIGIGETGVVVGESGSGKSSLLRLILGLPGIRRDDRVELKGEIELGGQLLFALDQGQIQELRRRIGVVKGVGGLIENMDVLRNITLPLAYHTSSMSVEEVDQRCEKIMIELDIAHLAASGRRPVALNSEERAYVSLARALIVEPTMLLADDPTLGMGELATQRFVAHLFAGGPMTRLVSTTRLLPYIKRADHFFLLEAGKLRPLGGMQEIIECDHPWVRAELESSRWD